MVGYFHGSDLGLAGVLYAVWQRELGSEAIDVRLITCKTKVAQGWDNNTVRREMTGAVLLSRLAAKVCHAVRNKPIELYLLGDSEIVLSSREKETSFFNEWYANCIGETFNQQKKIQEIVEVGDHGEWYHISSMDNSADKPTRLDTDPSDIGMNSEWQRGKGYLKYPVASRPINRDFAAARKDKIDIPVKEVNQRYRGLVGNKASVNMNALDKIISVEVNKVRVKERDNPEAQPGDINNGVELYFSSCEITNSLESLYRRTSILYRWLHKVLEKKGIHIQGSEREKGRLFWMRVSMPATKRAHEKGPLKHLTLWEHEGIYVVTGRAQEGIRYFFGVDYLPVLMP